MCTLIVATGVWPGAPLVVAANRDERYDRPATGPKRSLEGGIPVLAPRDEQAGGTWLGVNAHGVFSAVTNRYTAAVTAAPRSRGFLVLDALRFSDARRGAEAVAAGDPRQHAPFHLVVADAGGAHVVWNDGERLHSERWDRGIHVVTQRSFGLGPSARIDTVQRLVQPLARGPLPATATWRAILSSAIGDAPMEAICVRMPEHGYGTRSSSIVTLTGEPSQAVFLHAEGPPNEVAYADHSKALRSLLAGATADGAP